MQGPEKTGCDSMLWIIRQKRVCSYLISKPGLQSLVSKFQRMASFSLNFLPPVHSTPNLKMFPLHNMAEILHARV